MVVRLTVLLSIHPSIRPSGLSAQCPDGSPPPCSRPVEALGWAALGVAIDSTQPATYWMMADADLLLGRPSEAQRVARKALRLGTPDAIVRSLLAEAYATGGDSTAARAELDSAAAWRAPRPAFPCGRRRFSRAAFAQLGEADSSLAWLARLRVGRRRFFRGFFERQWALAPVRADPRFQALLVELRP